MLHDYFLKSAGMSMVLISADSVFIICITKLIRAFLAGSDGTIFAQTIESSIFRQLPGPSSFSSFHPCARVWRDSGYPSRTMEGFVMCTVLCVVRSGSFGGTCEHVRMCACLGRGGRPRSGGRSLLTLIVEKSK